MLLFHRAKAESARLWWLSFLTCCALMISPVATALADETTDTADGDEVIVLVMVPDETNAENTGESDPALTETLPGSGDAAPGDSESGDTGSDEALPPSDPAEIPDEGAASEADAGTSSGQVDPAGVTEEEGAPAETGEVPADTGEQEGEAAPDGDLLKTAENSGPTTSLQLMSVEEAGLEDEALSSIAAVSEADSVSVLATGIVPMQDTPENVVGVLVGSGVTFSNVAYTGAPSAIGQFTGGTGIIGFNEGIIMSSGSIMDVVGPNDSSGTTTGHGLPGDADLSLLANGDTEDAAVLTFDFVPAGNQIVFSYVFSSEEYNEYVGSSYNDVFAFYVNGQNCATVQGGAVSINTINNDSNSAQYVDNTDAHLDTQMDGLTVVLTCSATVIPGASNTMKLAIADTGDSSLDSNVFIQAKSFTVPTPTPTPTEVPTTTPTPTVVAGEPTKPQQYAQPPAPAVAVPVTGLPNTGAGTQQSNQHYVLILAAAMGAGISLVGAIRSSKGQGRA